MSKELLEKIGEALFMTAYRLGISDRAIEAADKLFGKDKDSQLNVNKNS